VVVDVRSSSARDSRSAFHTRRAGDGHRRSGRRLEELPSDREIVFYCTCPNEASAAQVAKKLIGPCGYTKVHPLHGGLDAWIAAGYGFERR